MISTRKYITSIWLRNDLTRQFRLLDCKLKWALASEALKASECLAFPRKSYQLYLVSCLKQNSAQLSFDGGRESTTTTPGGDSRGDVLAKIEKCFSFPHKISKYQEKSTEIFLLNHYSVKTNIIDLNKAKFLLQEEISITLIPVLWKFLLT